MVLIIILLLKRELLKRYIELIVLSFILNCWSYLGLQILAV
jgi:hypothetical protein